MKKLTRMMVVVFGSLLWAIRTARVDLSMRASTRTERFEASEVLPWLRSVEMIGRSIGGEGPGRLGSSPGLVIGL